MDKEHVFFENYAHTWDADRKENKERLQRLAGLIGIKKGDTVLDVGCGTGVFLPYLHAYLGDEGHLEEFDYSGKMLDMAREKFGRLDNVSFTEGNVLKYNFSENTYDVVVCLNFYPHIRRYHKDFIKQIKRIVKDGGTVAILHDMSRQRVNAIHQGEGEATALLPPVDVLEAALISAGFTVEIAMDTKECYLVKVVKGQELSYGHDEGAAEQDAGRAALMHRHEHHHSHEQTKIVINRLARISGHLEAIRRMVEDGRDCSDVLVQLAAVRSALGSVSKVVLKDHIDHCIVDAIHENDVDAVENLKKAIATFIK